MVKRSLQGLNTSKGSIPDSLATKIGNLNQVNLRDITDSAEITKICTAVMSAIWSIMLVHVNEASIKKRKKVKDWSRPLEIDENTLWKDEAWIRSEWNTVDWLQNPPHGSIYFNEDGSILWVIYRSKEWWEVVFVESDVAMNPHASLLLFRTMNKNLLEILDSEEK